MPPSNPNKILRPSRTYDISLKIKSEYYTNDISNVRISSSLATGYQIVVVTINITPQTILLNKLYGGDEIVLVIKKLSYNESVEEVMVFNLMLVKSEFDITVSGKVLDKVEEGNRSSFDLITVPRFPFQTMSTMVNPVFGLVKSDSSPWKGLKTPKEMIETIVKQNLNTSPKLEYDTEDSNEDKILQCCVPPTTFMEAVKYIDNNFGLFNGASAAFCQYDNTLQIMNLSERMKKNFEIHVEHLTTEHDENDIKRSVANNNGKYFYTYDNLNTSYNGNSKFGVLGKTLKHIVLPSDKLSYTIEQDLNDICKNYGIVGTVKGQVTYINSSAATRTKYYIDNNGSETSKVFANAKISKKISDISRLSFRISHDLPIERLITIGVVVKLSTKSQPHIDISGKYILFSSDIEWSKGSEWSTTAKMELIRTNKTI